VKGAKKVLLSLYCSTMNEIKMEEITQIHEFMAKMGEDVTVIWGASFDDSLGDEVKITLIATGFDVKDIPGMPASILKKHKSMIDKDDEETVNSEEPISEEELEEHKKTTDAQMNKAIDELYGNTVKQAKPKDEVVQETIPFEAATVEEIPTVSIFELEDDENLKTIEQIPAWKRRFMKN